MLNEAVTPTLINPLLETMKTQPFSISIDGSDDLKKMNPITVRIYDMSCNMVVTHFLDMCTTASGKVKGIYDAMNTKLANLLKTSDPWDL